MRSIWLRLGTGAGIFECGNSFWVPKMLGNS